MGGCLEVKSEVGKGSTFSFRVSLKPAASSPWTAPLWTVNLHDLKVIVVDDNATNRRILQEMLRGFGCHSEPVATGAECLHALGQAARAGTLFGLALIDVQMPGMDGWQVLEAIRQSPQLDSLAVIMLTSLDENLRIRARRADQRWAAYLTKPIKQTQLLNTILETMGCQPPAVPVQLPAALPAEPGAPDQSRTLSRALHILLVEDNDINCKLARIILERTGHQVVTAENGREALERLKQADFDLIFMDVQMPEMDGFEATAAIRAAPPWAHLPIVAMTAYAMKGDRERCLAAGMDDYVSKPLRAADVLAAISRNVKPGQPAPGAAASG
jgi:CheY-like chemotaxis protein